MATVTTSIRTDAQLKREADRLFSDLGMNFSTAVNTFLRQAVREQGLSEAQGADLERHAYAVNDRVRDPGLRNRHILAAV